MPLERRHLIKALSAGGLGAAGAFPARPASAQRQIGFSYQQSSAVLITLKAHATLESRLRPRGFGVGWHLFNRIVDAMVTDAVDFHSDVADAVPIFAQAAGAPLAYYAQEAPSPQAEALIVRADSPVTSIAGLRGRRVGVSKGSGCHYLLLTVLRRSGLAASDIEIAYLEAAAGSAAFAQGALDAWAIWDPYLAITEARLPTRRLADGVGNSDYTRFYMVSTRFLEAHPDIVRIVFDALVEAGAWLHANPAAGAALLAPLWGGVPVAVIETVNRRRSYDVRPVTRASLVQQQRIADTYFEASLIPARLRTTDVAFWNPAGAG